MRRLLVLGSVAAIAVAATVQLGAGRAEPLRTLYNGADWRAAFAGRVVSHADDLAWLERGSVPGSTGQHDLVAQALLDLRGLTQPNGAVAAAPDEPWAYAWPRDNAFVAVAYAVSGHPDDAWRTLRFFVDAQLETAASRPATAWTDRGRRTTARGRRTAPGGSSGPSSQ